RKVFFRRTRRRKNDLLFFRRLRAAYPQGAGRIRMAAQLPTAARELCEAFVMLKSPSAFRRRETYFLIPSIGVETLCDPLHRLSRGRLDEAAEVVRRAALQAPLVVHLPVVLAENEDKEVGGLRHGQIGR